MPSGIEHKDARRPVHERYYYVSEDDEQFSKPEPVILGKRTRRATQKSLSTLTAPVAKKPRLEAAPPRPTQDRKISSTPAPLSDEHSDSESEIVGYMGKGKRWPMGRNAYHCHQCRNKTAILSATCINRRCGHKLFCARCLTLRYADLPRHIRIPTKKNILIPSCPRCEGFCSCSHCRAPRPDRKDGAQATPYKGRFDSHPAETSVSAPPPRLISAASWAVLPGSSTAGSSTPPIIEGIKRVFARPVFNQFSHHPVEKVVDELAGHKNDTSEPQVEPPSVRRKRDRKPIEPVEKEAVEEEAPPASLASAEAEPQPPQVKRGRGRPKKKAAAEVVAEVVVKQEALESDAAMQSSADEQSAPPTAKRGRGRPPKTTVAIPNEPTASSGKRKRGRPRKVPVVETAGSESEANNTSVGGENNDDNEKDHGDGDASLSHADNLIDITHDEVILLDLISADESLRASSPATSVRTRSQTRQAVSIKLEMLSDELQCEDDDGEDNQNVSAPMTIQRRGGAKVSVPTFGTGEVYVTPKRNASHSDEDEDDADEE
ncbi:hypothetical protein CYLTODRAFT_440684 [Cylindrobasidium torrendii FP15055 ss-10]|uniref:Zinc-finger domain-containing protein n=1 Tax=Cylindrobasidium torrendii FP15055 ss-10 TaxID=1314674 RepID=A0A0D7BPX0_9AGAR|nr:hypothetical protein CYLTODRAFT_440684 [Cylindrobasidium torrendii FP15055 ss-10]